MSLFTKFIRAMDTSTDNAINSNNNQLTDKQFVNRYWKKISLEKVSKCLEDLIEFFAQPNEHCSHEERQNKLKALRNRQDLFHEEGMITLVLETIDKYSETKNQASKMNIPLFEGYKQQVIDDIYDQLYALLAVMIKGNRNNCAQFAQGNRLDSLISRLTSQQTSRGVLEVLQCILIDSPEALNMIKERHIQGIISLLDRNGRDPKVK
jgi:ryanodine receptor 2